MDACILRQRTRPIRFLDSGRNGDAGEEAVRERLFAVLSSAAGEMATALRLSRVKERQTFNSLDAGGLLP